MVIDPRDNLCSCGKPLNDGRCPGYPNYPDGEHPVNVTMPAIWVCPPDLNPDCPCGHAWVRHDIYEPSDPRELCTVQGCDQRGCPGRSARENQSQTERTP